MCWGCYSSGSCSSESGRAQRTYLVTTLPLPQNLSPNLTACVNIGLQSSVGCIGPLELTTSSIPLFKLDSAAASLQPNVCGERINSRKGQYRKRQRSPMKRAGAIEGSGPEMKIVDISGANYQDIPDSYFTHSNCKSCLYWEMEEAPADQGNKETLKRKWFNDVGIVFGPCGKLSTTTEESLPGPSTHPPHLFPMPEPITLIQAKTPI